MPRTFKKAVDLLFIYEFIKRLSTPFKDWDAFKRGLINDKGEFLKPREMYDDQDRATITYFDILVINIKKLINKIPGGDNRIKNFAVALWLLKEEVQTEADALLINEARILKALDDSEEVLILPEKEFSDFMSEQVMVAGGAPASNATDSIGGGYPGPVVKKKAQKKWRTANWNGMRAYYVPEDVFTRCCHGKTDTERFSAFIQEPDMLEDMREYAKKYSDQPILLHNEKTGSYHFLKYGKRFKHLRQR